MNIKPNKKILCLLIFCNLFMSVTGVSAFENPGHQHNEELLNIQNHKSSNIISVNQAQQNKEFTNKSISRTIGTFKQLNKEIQEAIENNKTVIELNCDYYYYKQEDKDLNEGIAINKNIIINGNGHTIDGSEMARAFKISAKEVTINQLYIKNTKSNNGGAIYSEKTNLNINQSLFEENSATDSTFTQCKGGSIYSEEGILNIYHSTFNNNNAEDYGGAVYSNKKIILNNCEFNNNLASDNDGGAVYCKENINVINTNFKENKAYEDGGALYSEKNIDINNSKFEKNLANGAKVSQCEGGAVYANGPITVNNSKFNNNKAYDYGGAIWTNNDITLRDCSFMDNSVSDNDGGAIYSDGSRIKAYNNDFINNHADSKGGVIYCDDGSSNTYLEDNNFVNNSCGSNKGSSVYTDGYFSKICNNWWGTPTPNWGSGLLWEDTWNSHIIHHDESPRTQPRS